MTRTFYSSKNYRVIFLLFIGNVFYFWSGVSNISGQKDSNKEFPICNDLDTNLKQLSSLYSFLIFKSDSIVFEKYYNGFNNTQSVNVKSVSKSILSLLLGIMDDEKLIQSINDPIYRYFPKLFDDTVFCTKCNITIEHLLTMSSGLRSTSGEYYSDWTLSENWMQYVLQQEMLYNAGEQFNYSTGNTHLLSGIMEEVIDISLYKFASHFLFNEIDASIKFWEQDPQGYYTGGNNMYLTPRDMGQVGLLVLNKGLYNNKRIISNEWIEKSTSIHVPFENKENTDSIFCEGYGFLWWVYRLGETPLILAAGYGGQLIAIIRELDLVIVSTSDWDKQVDGRKDELLRIIKNMVIPTFK